MSATFAPSTRFREITDWEISASVTSQHRCAGAECEYFDTKEAKSTMDVAIDDLEHSVGNAAASLSLRIYLVESAVTPLATAPQPYISISPSMAGPAIHASPPSPRSSGRLCDGRAARRLHPGQ